jgi:hypothetical protein
VGIINNENINELPTVPRQLYRSGAGFNHSGQGGSPGQANTTLRIRGLTTLTNNDALLIVDGVEQRISDINPMILKVSLF